MKTHTLKAILQLVLDPTKKWKWQAFVNASYLNFVYLDSRVLVLFMIRS